VPASVKAQLLSLARTGAEDFNSVLTRYVLERFLYRLSISPFAGEFLLKGAILFTVWSQRPHRATKDIDLLGFGEPSLARLVTSIGEVCATPVSADDGVRFDGDTVHRIDAAPLNAEGLPVETSRRLPARGPKTNPLRLTPRE